MNDEEHKEPDTSDPDTNTDDEIGDLQISESEEVQEAIPVAEEPPPPPEQPAPALPPGPRTFPQHYTLLFASVMVAVAAMAVWERAHVFGKDIVGHPSGIAGTFLLTMGAYGVIIGMLNILQGRLRGMMAAFVTGVAALYFGIKAFVRTLNHDGCLGLNEIKNFVNDPAAIPQRFADDASLVFPKDALSSFEDHKEIYSYWVGQFGPGVWWSIVGGALIVLVFLKAFMPAKKAEPAPAPRSRSGRRR
jgi:predicted small integral membrane protein